MVWWIKKWFGFELKLHANHFILLEATPLLWSPVALTDCNNNVDALAQHTAQSLSLSLSLAKSGLNPLTKMPQKCGDDSHRQGLINLMASTKALSHSNALHTDRHTDTVQSLMRVRSRFEITNLWSSIPVAGTSESFLWTPTTFMWYSIRPLLLWCTDEGDLCCQFNVRLNQQCFLTDIPNWQIYFLIKFHI